jgi:GNAT superfamily N-acetyltransferase
MYTTRLIPNNELDTTIPFIRLLNPAQSDEEIRARFPEMIARGYLCAGVYDGERLIAVSGLWILLKHYVGRHIEPDNVIVHPDYRGKGVGEELMAWIYEYGRQQGCAATELNCYVNNEQGIKFWKAQGYEIVGHHFQKKLI